MFGAEMKRARFFFIGLLVILIPLVLAQLWKDKKEPKPVVPAKPMATYQPPVDPEFKKLLTQYDREIESLMQTSETPGVAIAIIKDSSIVFMKGYGIKAVGNNRDSVGLNTVFRIASVSKCFAACLTGMLVADSTLAWDNKITQYLPAFSLSSTESTNLLTIRHVLSHTTGLPYHTYTNLVEEGMDLPSLLGMLKNVNVARTPGTEYSYQNVAYSLIGEVIKNATGKTYEEIMMEKVFQPLNMKTASIDYTSLMTNVDIAKPHKMRQGHWVPASITNTYYNVAPAGGVNASISDMAQWMIALLGNRTDVISRQTLAQLFAPEIKAPSKNRNYGRTYHVSSSYYGLGWRILHYPNDTLVYHGGFVNGYRSEVAVNTKEKIAICLLANAPGVVADTGIPLFFNMLKAQRDSVLAYDNRKRNLLAKVSTP
jgi:beta-lactamase class C